MTTTNSQTELQSFAALETHARKASVLHLRDLFAADHDRGRRLHWRKRPEFFWITRRTGSRTKLLGY